MKGSLHFGRCPYRWVGMYAAVFGFKFMVMVYPEVQGLLSFTCIKFGGFLFSICMAIVCLQKLSAIYILGSLDIMCTSRRMLNKLPCLALGARSACGLSELKTAY